MCQEVTLSSQDSIFGSQETDRIAVNAIAKQLVARIGTERYELWFSELDCFAIQRTRAGSVERLTVVVFAENDFSLQRLQKKFAQEIRTVVDRVCHPQAEISYQVRKTDSQGQPATNEACVGPVDPTTLQPPQVSDKAVTLPMRAPRQSDQPTSNNGAAAQRRLRGLGSFWFGSTNRLVNAGVSQLLEQPGQFSPFFVYGPTGSGKTHLLSAIVNDYRRKLDRKRCLFMSAEQFTSQFVSSLRGGTGLPMFRQKYRDLDILAIDDIQFLAGKRATLDEFQHTIDDLIQNGKQVVVSADRPPIELGHLGSDVSARLSGGLTCPLEYPDLEGRISIAKKMCADRKLTLPGAVLRLVCERLSRDVRRLSGAVNRLFAHSVSLDEKITPELTQHLLSDLFSLSGPNCTSMVSIEQAVCDICGVEPAELKSSSRQKRVSSARMLAMYLSREYTASAFSEIGEYFGGRSHSTAIAAKKKVDQWLNDDTGISLRNAVYTAKDIVRRIESTLRIG